MNSVGSVVGRFTTYVINPALLVLAAAGFFFFVWGLMEFMVALNQGAKTEDGKQHMLWGTVGMVIMFSVAGIIALINSTFNFGISPGQNFTPNNTNLQNVNPGATFFGQ